MSGHEHASHTVPQQEKDTHRAFSPARNGARAGAPADLLSRLWKQNLPLLRERVACLESAAEEAVAGSLSPARRTEASDLAHKLAGSLGMFGYPAGTDIARLMEQHLETGGPVDPALFHRLVAELRSVLPLQ